MVRTAQLSIMMECAMRMNTLCSGRILREYQKQDWTRKLTERTVAFPIHITCHSQINEIVPSADCRPICIGRRRGNLLGRGSPRTPSADQGLRWLTRQGIEAREPVWKFESLTTSLFEFPSSVVFLTRQKFLPSDERQIYFRLFSDEHDLIALRHMDDLHEYSLERR
jgi:hypothetical protein